MILSIVLVIWSPFCRAAKKSEDFQGFFSKTLLIFGGRRCRSLFHLHSALRHSKLACHAVLENIWGQKIRPIFTNTISVKVQALKFADRFWRINFVCNYTAHPNNIGNSIGSRLSTAIMIWNINASLTYLESQNPLCTNQLRITARVSFFFSREF